MSGASPSGLTHDHLGSMFICGSGVALSMPCYRQGTPLAVAGRLLEETGEWRQALQDLPADFPLPPGVAEAVDAAYRASLAWMDLLERAAKP